ncbi:hypothetical protein A3A63_03930 [Candidatus Gottesmanbacteria bacterium RIFCSPLOWO2_01_FULL_46_9]|uniref:TrpR like protein, YerC/YecD n=1 Tax=Candidatus Gottesmanbacteria bacterium RIFCSPLOWO2_01_FULL_46_9 TaxID=1798394 RepID=A0A1F6B0R1_9BACT|nr:MAG: hypothetical protein A3A63_03930 [Candidatus Gottesmanbacteria bacterium RIFCSPLOWO2_01_FULL_46_9]
MTQISRNPLSKKMEDQMFSLFRGVLVDLNDEDDVAYFLDDLLSPTEKIMLGKRLAIAFLLEKGYDQRAIHTILKVSTSTVNSVNYWLQRKGQGYRKVIGMVRKAEKWQAFVEGLDKSLQEVFSAKAWHRRAYGGMSEEEDTPLL